MNFITREEFDKYIKNESVIDQKERMTKSIFKNKEILKQLRESALEPDEHYIDLDNETALSKINANTEESHEIFWGIDPDDE